MTSIIDFYNSPRGRWIVRVVQIVLGALAQGGVIPIDYAIPGIGLTVGQVLVFTGIGTPSAPGSVKTNTIAGK